MAPPGARFSPFEDKIQKPDCDEKEQVAEPGTLNSCPLQKLLPQLGMATKSTNFRARLSNLLVFSLFALSIQVLGKQQGKDILSICSLFLVSWVLSFFFTRKEMLKK